MRIYGALRYLWARHRITLLSDYNRLKASDERVQEVTNLGLTYNLLTAYTSFVAVDTQVRLEDGRSHTLRWTRAATGEMTVALDGRELLRATDRGFGDAFDGFTIVNRGGDYTVREVSVYGAE